MNKKIFVNCNSSINAQLERLLGQDWEITTNVDVKKSQDILSEESFSAIITDSKTYDTFYREFLSRPKHFLTLEFTALIVVLDDNRVDFDKLSNVDDFISLPIDETNICTRVEFAINKHSVSHSLFESKAFKRFTDIMRIAPGGVIILDDYDKRPTTKFVNNAVFEMFGYDKDDYVDGLPNNLLSFVNLSDINGLKYDLSIANERNKVCNREIRVTCADGSSKWILLSAKFLSDEGDKTSLMMLLIDIGSEVNSRKELEYLAKYDELSKVYNRRTFYKRVRELLDLNPNKDYVFIRLNIEHFKLINDLFGVEKGDDLLKLIGKKFNELFSGYTAYGRIEADNFGMFFEKGLFTIDELVNTLCQSVKAFDKNYNIILDFGVMYITDKSISIENISDRANLALNTIKGNYAVRYAFYDEQLRNKLLSEQSIVNDMKSALEEDQFCFYLQPIVNCLDNTLVGAEALVRWLHPTRGLIPPSEFLPVFEENGFITQIDKFIWESVCKLLKRWKDEGQDTVPISINISRLDIIHQDLVSFLVGLVKKYDIDVNMLKLEITESAYVENPKLFISIVEQLHANGFTIEMDDFGSGYSSFNTLKDVPFDLLKIDMRFLEGESSSKSGTILSSIVSMSKWLDLPVIAEGVETISQVQYLKSIGCYNIQGYYYSRPLPVNEFEKLFAKQQIGALESQGITNQVLHEDFWSLTSKETQMFNIFVGGSAIIEVNNGRLSIIRANDRFFVECGYPREVFNSPKISIMNHIFSEDIDKIWNGIKQADEEKEALFVFRLSNPTSSDTIWIRGRVVSISKSSQRNIYFFGIMNITDTKRLEESLSKMNSQFQRVIDNLRKTNLNLQNTQIELSNTSETLNNIIANLPVGVGIFQADGDYSMIYVSDKWCEMFGYTKDEYVKKFQDYNFDLLKNYDFSQTVDFLGTDGSKFASEFKYVDPKTGSVKWLSLVAVKVANLNKENLCYTILDDATKRVQNEQKIHWQMERNKIIVEDMRSITFDYDPETDIMTFEKMNDDGIYYEHEMTQYLSGLRKVRGVVHPDSLDTYITTLKIACKKPMKGTLEFRANFFEKGTRWMRVHYISLNDEEGKIYRIVGRVDDINEEVLLEQSRYEVEDKLRHKAENDFITNLYNKETTEEKINYELPHVSKCHPCAFFIGDIDNFKEINDTHGHLVGDELLRNIGYILKTISQPKDIIGRIGGDEFVGFMPRINSLDDAKKFIAEFNTRIATLKEKLGLMHNISASFGIVYVDKDTELTFKDLYRMADSAMYKAKQQGKNRYVVYSAKRL